MCGIAGRFNFDRRPVPAELIARMAEQLTHRGPDDEGFRVEGAIGLASRRLSIIDLDTGRQPIASGDNTVWVVLNGEIYNFVELRDVLERRGHRFRTRTDTEVIVHLYEDHGVRFLEHVRGMFGVAVWDERQRTLLLARDRLGEKPLYYAHRPGRSLAFASEPKALLVDPELQVSLDIAALDQYLSLLYVPAPASIFAEVRKLPAGHYLLASERGLEIREYWDVPLPPEGEEDRLDVDALRAALDEAVRIQLRSDVPLGAFLSGGIDSTTVVATIADHLGPGVVTCSVGFADDGYSELAYAERVAAAVGGRHCSRLVEAPTPELLDRLGWHFDEPFGDSSAVPTFAVSGLAREQVTVALSGDGGDELFGGYQRHAVESWEHALRRWANGAAPTVARVARLLPSGLPGKNALARLGIAPAEACAAKFQFGAGAPGLKSRIYSGDMRRAIASVDPLAQFAHAYARAAGVDPLNRILYVDLKTYLADDILVKVDRMSMAQSLEVRAPFLDHRLVEMVARLPGRVKVPGPATKPLLRGLLGGRVPRETWDRPKHGFIAPIARWLREDLRDCVEARLFSATSLGRGLFDSRGVRELWTDHLVGRADHSHELWMLLMLETWHARQPIPVAV